MKKWYVYKTTNLINGMEYIGCHGSEDIEKDRYLGSGLNLKKDIKKYGKKNFKREILYVYDDRKKASKKENELVDAKYARSKKTYNLQVGGIGGYCTRLTNERCLYVLRNIHTGRIIDVKIDPNRFIVIGTMERLDKRYYPTEKERNNAYKRYKRRIGRILRRPKTTQ